MKKNLIKITILLSLIFILGISLFFRLKSSIINKENIVGSFVYKVACEKDTTKGENGFSITTITLNKNNTFLIEIDDCFNTNVLDGEYSLDEKSKTLLLQNSTASYAKIFSIKDVNTIIEKDYLDRELIYKRK